MTSRKLEKKKNAAVTEWSTIAMLHMAAMKHLIIVALGFFFTFKFLWYTRF
jgi:hypothetical protein